MREIKHLSIHQWIRFAIPDSQQPTSPIGFLFLKLPPPPCAVLLVIVHIKVGWFEHVGKIKCLVASITVCISCVSNVTTLFRKMIHALFAEARCQYQWSFYRDVRAAVCTKFDVQSLMHELGWSKLSKHLPVWHCVIGELPFYTSMGDVLYVCLIHFICCFTKWTIQYII